MWVSNIEFKKLVDRVKFLEGENETRVKQIVSTIEDLDAKIIRVNRDLVNALENMFIENKRINLKMDEYDRQLREDMERGFTGVVRTFDKRLEQLGDKRGIVTDLLKKIASLENTDVHS